jgi:ribosomal protein S27AE
MTEEKLKCPKCGSTLIQQITNACRCGQCGFQFNEEKHPQLHRSEGYRGLPPHKHGRDG